MSALSRSSRVRTSLVVAIVAVLAGACFVAQAQDRRNVPSAHEAVNSTHSMAALEARFWRCDFEATQSMVDQATAADCSQATEELRMAKFNGDFNAMLDWWRQHRSVAHRAVQSRTQPAPANSALEDEIRRMPDNELRQMYLRCARVTEQRRLDGDEVVACSVGQDSLLTRTFGGDFDALLAWSKRELASAADLTPRKN